MRRNKQRRHRERKINNNVRKLIETGKEGKKKRGAPLKRRRGKKKKKRRVAKR